MIKAIAIDDEPLALKIIENFCKESPQIQLEKTFSKPTDALKYISNFPVDLLFLDIQMPSISGIDFYKNLNQEVMVIFTTAYSEYAVDGFNLNAIDFLLKPFTLERFQQAVNKAEDFYSYSHTKENVSNPYLFVRADYSLVKIKIADIIYIEGLNDYLKFHIENQKPVVARMTLKTLQEKLPAKDFVRSHRSYIVPIQRIIQIKNKMIYLSHDGKMVELPIGKSYEDELAKFF